MAFAKSNSTAASLAALYTDIRTFVESTLGWTAKKTGTLSDIGSTDYVIWESLGESTDEEIRAGMCKFYRDDPRCGLMFNGYTGYDSGLDFRDQPGTICPNPTAYCCGYNYMPGITIHNTVGVEYWLIGDKDFVAGVVRTSTFYTSFYLGLLRRYALRCQDPYPMLVDGSGPFVSSALSLTCFNCCQTSITNPYRTTSCGPAYIYGGASFEEWRHYANCSLAGHCGCAHGLHWPTNLAMGEAAGDNYPLIPCLIGGPDGMRGEYKYVYKVPGTGLAAEDTVTIGGDQYIVFPDFAQSGDEWWYAFRDYV